MAEPLSPAVVARAVAAYVAGEMAVKAICADYGISSNCLRQHVRAAGATTRVAGRRPENVGRNAEICRLWREGVSIRTLAARYGLSRAGVHDILERDARRRARSEAQSEVGPGPSPSPSGQDPARAPKKGMVVETLPAPSGRGYGAHDVVSADPAHAAADAAPLWGGRYPRAARARWIGSGCSSPAGVCADLGG